MRKRLFAILMAVALFVVAGPVEMVSAEDLTISAKVSSKTTNSITLSWSYDGGSPEGDVTIKNGSKVVDTVDASKTSYKVTGLKADTSYTFTVSADGASDTVTASTEKIKINGLKVMSGYKAVKVKWSKVEGAAKYDVKYSGKVRGKKKSGTKTVSTNACKITGFKEFDVTNTKKSPVTDKDFTFKVTAKDSSGNVIATKTIKGFPVRTMYYKLTFKKSASLTSHSGGKKTLNFRKGQTVYARGFDGGRFIFDYKCPDGKIRTYYTMKIRVVPSIWKNHIDPKTEYTEAEAEFYANGRGINSKTKNMIWINTYSQREYVFKGKKGKWNVIKGPWLVSTGKASKPTATGSTNINRRSPSEHGIPNWNVTRHFSLHGKHSSWKLGWPKSGACVRNYNENAKWIYENTPLRTRVYVF